MRLLLIIWMVSVVGWAASGGSHRAGSRETKIPATPPDLEAGKISGSWTLEIVENKEKGSFIVEAKAITLPTPAGPLTFFPFKTPYRLADGSTLMGMQSEKDRIILVEKRADGTLKPERHIVLKQTGNLLSVGGDHETYEIFRLTKTGD